MSSQPHHEILIIAINARYSHCSHSIRVLKANLGQRSNVAAMLEFDLEIHPWQLAETIVAYKPRVVAFSAYLWNIKIIESTARILQIIAPGLLLTLGGPEITTKYKHSDLFDLIIIGEGETTLRQFCENLDNSSSMNQGRAGVIHVAPDEQLDQLKLPYHLYTEHDIKQRTVYVETTRGCPFTCGYCTSANTKLRLFDLKRLLPAFDKLLERGLLKFKFLDRTFNAPVQHACQVLDFFLQRYKPGMMLHLEIQPDFLHPAIAERIAAFPVNALHLEVGIQTVNPAVAASIGRSRNTEQALANLSFLIKKTGAIVHTDLIFGLPGENQESFKKGFNRIMYESQPAKLQVNLLKGLPGTKYVLEAQSLGLHFSPEPPYELLASDAMSFATLCEIQRFARCWELVYNRGNFPEESKALQQKADNHDLYSVYHALAEWIYQQKGQLHAISRHNLSQLLHCFLEQL